MLLDTSPCVMRLKDHVRDPALKAAIYEPAEFASKLLLPRLAITPQAASVAMHVPCSGKKMKVSWEWGGDKGKLWQFRVGPGEGGRPDQAGAVTVDS